MDLTRLNPLVRSASIYERPFKGEETVAYDSRLIYIISGDMTATVGGEKLGHLSPGHALFIPPAVPYKLKAQFIRAAIITFDPTVDIPEPTERIAPVSPAEFDPEKCHSVSNIPPFDRILHLDDMESERDCFLRMCNIYTSAEGSYLARISAMLKLVLLKMAETADDSALPARMVEELDSYIRDNIGDEISNTEIGAIFGYHPFYVSKLLKDKKGQTLRQYVIAYRLKAAKRLLELTAKSINEIAEECGFTDASYFTKTFRQSCGMTPKEYRNSFKDELI